MTIKFHHVGIAVRSIEAAIDDFGCSLRSAVVSDVISDAQLGVKLCLITFREGGSLELVSGTPVESFLVKGSPIYHICFECESVEYFLRNFSGICIPLSKKTGAKLFNNRNVQFFNTPLGIIEVLECS